VSPVYQAFFAPYLQSRLYKFWSASSPLCWFNNGRIFVYYTYSRTQLYFTQQYSRYTTTCFGPICGLSSGCDSTYRAAIQDVWGVVLNFVYAIYCFIVLLIGWTCFGNYYAHHQEVATIITKNIVYYTYSRTQLYFTQRYSKNTTTCFGPMCGPSSGCGSTYRTAIQDVWGVVLGGVLEGGGKASSCFSIG